MGWSRGACDRDVTDGGRRPVGPTTDEKMEGSNDERAVRQVERRRRGPVNDGAILRAAPAHFRHHVPRDQALWLLYRDYRSHELKRGNRAWS